MPKIENKTRQFLKLRFAHRRDNQTRQEALRYQRPSFVQRRVTRCLRWPERDHRKIFLTNECVVYGDPGFIITAPFNNMRTLKFKDQRTNTFLTSVNQMFGDSS